MSGPNESDGRPGDPPDSQSVLANLPRTRPQRSTARRAAARKAAASNGAVTLAETTTPQRATGASRPAAQAKAAAAPKRKPQAARSSAAKRRPRSAPKRPTAPFAGGASVPIQGFECEGESARGPVQPPGGAELVTSALEIVGELAKAGVSTGERLLRDALSRLSPS